MEDVAVEVFINHDETGDAVAICFHHCSVVEIDGELCAIIELEPGHGLELAAGIAGCADLIINHLT